MCNQVCFSSKQCFLKIGDHLQPAVVDSVTKRKEYMNVYM
jgi:hypothetical protein